MASTLRALRRRATPAVACLSTPNLGAAGDGPAFLSDRFLLEPAVCGGGEGLAMGGRQRVQSVSGRLPAYFAYPFPFFFFPAADPLTRGSAAA